MGLGRHGRHRARVPTGGPRDYSRTQLKPAAGGEGGEGRLNVSMHELNVKLLLLKLLLLLVFKR